MNGIFSQINRVMRNPGKDDQGGGGGSAKIMEEFRDLSVTNLDTPSGDNKDDDSTSDKNDDDEGKKDDDLFDLGDGTKVAKDELIKGYLRQSDYTKKMQELSAKKPDTKSDTSKKGTMSEAEKRLERLEAEAARNRENELTRELTELYKDPVFAKHDKDILALMKSRRIANPRDGYNLYRGENFDKLKKEAESDNGLYVDSSKDSKINPGPNGSGFKSKPGESAYQSLRRMRASAS